MSKNHPNDNIYSILGKLEALKPTPEEKRFALVKEIQESVEAQGSIIEGVDAIEAKLKQQFNEAGQRQGFLGEPDLVGIPGPAKGTKPSPNAITKGADREYYKAPGLGGTTVTKWRKKTTAEGVCSECGMTEGSCEHSMAEGEFAGGPATYGVYIVGHNDGKPVKTFDSEAEAEAYANKGVRVGNKLLQGSVRTIVGEGETTHKGGEKVATKLGTLHKSKATVDTEKELSRGDVPDLDADDAAPAVSAEKKGRGRPKMATKDRSQASMPWGGNPPKDTYKHQKGSLVHKISESRLYDDTGETLQHILNRFRHEVRNFEQGGDLDNDLYDALYDYYCESGEMPYGTQKARTGDPMRWVAEKLETELGDIAYGKDPANAEGAGLEMEAGIPGNLPASQIPGKEALLKTPTPGQSLGRGIAAGVKDTLGGLKDFVTGKPEDPSRPTYEDTAMEAELNELAKLAGLQTTEGNAFSGKLAQAKAQGASSFEVGGKELPVKEAGIAVDQPDEEDLANDPEEEYASVDVITSQGDDLNRQKKQDPHTANKAANPLTNTPTLEARLQAEYDSIKKKVTSPHKAVNKEVSFDEEDDSLSKAKAKGE